MRSLLTLTLLIMCFGLAAQQDAKVVQFSGRVIAVEEGKIEKLIYTNIAVKGTSRGTTSDIDGFFSLPVREGETVVFSRIGYERKEFTIPVVARGISLTKDIILSKDTLFLPETLIYPWPDKDFFKIEFLALEVGNSLEDLAADNLSPEKLEVLREMLPVDGGEISKMELRQAAQSYYYYGQIRPQNIFNPLSWKKFIDAIKRGDFKQDKN